MSGNPALQTIIGFAAIIGALIFFSSVNLTQAQAVSAMFLCIGAVVGLWFWKKPWK